MKLRIRGNSIRLRLTKAEVARVGAGERVEEAISFAANADERLIYAVAPVAGESVRASFASNEVCVTIPCVIARQWAEGAAVSIEGKQPVGEGATLTILVEKDFSCLKPRDGEDDSDAFPNPSANA